MKIAGLDIGTTGCKCTVFDEQGKYLDKAYKDYPVTRGLGGHEIDINALMEGVFFVILEMAKKYPDIAGLGVTSFGETFVFTDEKGNPLHKAMLYTDPRGYEECKTLIDKFGEREIANITGLRPHEMYSISKMMWIKNHEPELYQKASHAFLMQDLVVFWLTGVAQMDYSLATRTMAFDIRNLKWSKEIIEESGIDLSLFPKVVPTGTAAGNVTGQASELTGLSTDTIVVSIAHDQVAACVGAGAFDSETAVDGAGTVECLIPIYDELPNMDKMYEGYYAVVPHVLPGKYVAYAFSYTGGALMQWCTDNLTKKERELAKADGLSVNEYLEKDYSSIKNQDLLTSDPSNLLVLPHFAGAATPYMDTGSKGAIIGLTTDTKVSEIYRGCMEGVVYEMCLNYKKLKGSGIKFKSLNATGGGAHSAVWMQMKADMLNLPITALKTVDAGTVGSAMLTGIAIGIFKDLEDAASYMVDKTITYHPRKEMHDKYMAIFERYEKVYEAVRPLV